ncbi:tetratricopeptide repeat protein [Kitasatospora sp. NPDC051914]|uniref:tetratricopeptide repeat protein n=1 Tax=Kitasatospora sp. NPDC051914 TaxID=3154945 RepID=UPI003420E6A6
MSGRALAEARTVLAEIVRLSGRTAEAAEVARSALAAEPGAAEYADISARRTLARALGDLGRHSEAAESLASLAARTPRTGGTAATHLQDRVNALVHLAYLGRHEEVTREAAAVRIDAASADGEARELVPLSALTSLAFSLSVQGCFQEAEALLRPAVAQTDPRGREQFVRTLQLGLGRALVGQGRAEEAWQIVGGPASAAPDEPLVAAAANAAPQDASATALIRATTLLALDRPIDAELEARRCIELCESHLGEFHHRRLEADTALGTALARQGEHDEAVELLTADLHSWHAHFGDEHHGTKAARLALTSATTYA